MAKVVTFGELMIRLQPYNYERFVQADHLEFSFGGGEANVAVSLANYGLDAAFVTKLPAHAIGQCAVNSLRRYGVDKPDTLFGLELEDVTGIVRHSNFKLFASAPLVKAMRVPGGEKLTRKEIDELTEFV